MKFWQKPGSVPKYHFGTPSDCQLKNEGCLIFMTNLRLSAFICVRKKLYTA
ncbi:MAG: hypothetical protein GY795_15250 [Desulfobacterales bacterium]|nr:hypothetical protein [Desulfobacterales bacterium]